MNQIIPIGIFKKQCYQLSQQIAEKDLELTITKHGKPLVRVVACNMSSKGRLNALKGTALFADDLIEPIKAAWNVMEEGV